MTVAEFDAMVEFDLFLFAAACDSTDFRVAAYGTAHYQ